MTLALGIIGIWFGLGALALCACVVGSRVDHARPVPRPAIDETSHPARIAA